MYTMRDPVRRATQLFGDREAVVFGDVRRSYAEFGSRVLKVAGLLSGITEPGDRVALWALNSDRYLELFIGIPAAGRAIVPHNTRWAEPELAYATADAGARVLISDRDPGELGDLAERVIRLDTGEYDALLADAPEMEPDISPDTLAGLFYTGGTTGTSKGVMLTHANLMANAGPHPALPAPRGRRPLPDHRSDVPRGRRLLRARPAVGRCGQCDSAGLRARRQPRRDRA